MVKTHRISPDKLSLSRVSKLVKKAYQLELSSESRKRIAHCRQYLEGKLTNSDTLFYGINTGFGSLCNVPISDEETELLQSRLVQSHACGMGDEVPAPLVRLILFLKIQSLASGYSGVRAETIERLIAFYNEDLLPVIYQQGSLGASGDLAPLAHLSLALIGMGEVHLKGQRMTAKQALKKLGLKPLTLKSKEGLALLNGTQFSSAYLCWATAQAQRLLDMANMTAALSIDAFNCQLAPFDERLHYIRGQQGQIQCAASIRDWLTGSGIAAAEKQSVQDPYAFRCVPQVHGASADAIAYCTQIATTEINAVTDNPNIFPDDDAIISGGNFHAQPLALALDFLAIALAELGSIAERRTYQLISGTRGLPAFLIPQAGLNSGLMIPQYTAASIVSQNKQLCTPASVDSIVSSNGQEDHVSMAANAATKVYRVVENIERLLAIEWMTAAQALEFRRPLKTSARLESLMSDYRKQVPALESDRILSTDMHATVDFLRQI